MRFPRLVILAIGAVAAASATLAPPTASAVTTTGDWTAPFTPAGPSSRVIGVHQVLLHNGQVLVFGNLRPTEAYVYDPATGTAAQTNPPADVECGAMVTLADGRVLVVGGHAKGATGIDNIVLFDPNTLTWTEQPITAGGRYYPTATLLANGTVLISGGFDHNGANNTNVEVYTPPPAGSDVGTIRNVGQHLGGLYPHQWLMPDGNVLEVQRLGAYILNTNTWQWTQYAKPGQHGSGEGAVLLPGSPSGSTKVMMIGGGSNTGAFSLTDTFNEATPTAGWSKAAPIPEPRTHMQPVMTPNGSIIGIGGNAKGNFGSPNYYNALSYDPQANSWTTLAAQAQRRAYHSSAVLLPDGRIMSAGDTGAGGGGNTVEIFSPSYLGGPRPTITSAPSQVANGGTFSISTPDTGSRAVLMAPGAATHTVDFTARNIPLATNSGTGEITATAPSANVAAPGYYMLFLVDSSGTPSVAKWVHIG